MNCMKHRVVQNVASYETLRHMKQRVVQNVTSHKVSRRLTRHVRKHLDLTRIPIMRLHLIIKVD